MDSEAIKSEVIRQVRTQYAMDNAKQLIDKINEHCFERCVPKPGNSLSSGEQTCFTQCMEKYMAGWNKISASYIQRLQREQ
ncbi:putative mitochondrial import inner membrane translocase subunit tim13 protein [Rosellinia necatrix]|uniref:Mitochondrial import inner membrane translocase subunit n=1 Tax=Rosellinia necatrix TaxID=77044 RepID=A0A1S8AA18_ROSNE|nr:putative mitochondrial import inner membrane translocase subunit tim13 protein [Rosellinia necatrix]